jgi:hypothetical protein
MKTEPSKGKALVDKEEIINYEVEILEQQIPQAKPIVSHSNKFSTWELASKIREVLGSADCSVRWVGNSPTAYLETYALVLLIGSGHSESNILEFKHSIYKLGRECLELREQKLLVEFLCLIEYCRDRYSFLNKYPEIEAIFIKILQFVEDDHHRSTDSAPDSSKKAKVRRKAGAKGKLFASNDSALCSSQELTIELELEEIYQSFSHHFEFITILGSNEHSCTLKLFNDNRLYILIEKDCYFIVEQKAEEGPDFLEEFTDNNIIRDFDRIIN